MRNRVSLPALMREEFPGAKIRRQRRVLANEAYTRHEVTYRSGGVTVSGVLLKPRGRGPFPRSCSTTATSSRRSTSPGRA